MAEPGPEPQPEPEPQSKYCKHSKRTARKASRAPLFARFIEDLFKKSCEDDCQSRTTLKATTVTTATMLHERACDAKSSGVFDVAGGSGELAFQMHSLRNIPTTVIDPRPELKLDRALRRYQNFQRSHILGSQFHVARDHPHLIPELVKHTKPVETKQVVTPGPGSHSAAAAPDTKHTLDDDVPRPGPDSLSEANVQCAHTSLLDATTLNPIMTKEEREAEFMKLVVDRITFGGQSWDKGMNGIKLLATSPLVNISRLHPCVLEWMRSAPSKYDLQLPHHVPMYFPTISDVDRVLAYDEANQCNPSTPLRHSPTTCANSECTSSTPLPQLVELVHRLQNAAVIIGMHADGATEPLIDFALRFGVPFAVVPCCVFPKDNPHRTLQDGTFVAQYDHFITYLLEKSPIVQKAELPFEGRNIVLYGNVPDP
jgi:hypothetical protein